MLRISAYSRTSTFVTLLFVTPVNAEDGAETADESARGDSDR